MSDEPKKTVTRFALEAERLQRAPRRVAVFLITALAAIDEVNAFDRLYEATFNHEGDDPARRSLMSAQLAALDRARFQRFVAAIDGTIAFHDEMLHGSGPLNPTIEGFTERLAAYRRDGAPRFIRRILRDAAKEAPDAAARTTIETPGGVLDVFVAEDGRNLHSNAAAAAWDRVIGDIDVKRHLELQDWIGGGLTLLRDFVRALSTATIRTYAPEVEAERLSFAIPDDAVDDIDQVRAPLYVTGDA